MKMNQPGRQKSDRSEILAVGKALEALFSSISDVREGTFDCSDFSAEGTVNFRIRGTPLGRRRRTHVGEPKNYRHLR